MAILIRRHSLNPRGRNLDAAKVLYVCRRIPTGTDEHGVQTYLPPGSVFNPAGVKPHRLEHLFRAKFIDHALPRGIAPIAPASATPRPVADQAPAAPRPPRAPRPAARS